MIKALEYSAMGRGETFLANLLKLPKVEFVPNPNAKFLKQSDWKPVKRKAKK